MNAQSLISKVWSFCHMLRDDGVGYGDYLEQLTYLIFLKLADEYSRPPDNRAVGTPPLYDWDSLKRANVLFFDNRPGRAEPWTREVWFYEYRTNVHHTLKRKPLRFDDLQEFIECYKPQDRQGRQPTWARTIPRDAGAASASKRS